MVEYYSLALIKITKSPYQEIKAELTLASLALIKITKSPYLKDRVLGDIVV